MVRGSRVCGRKGLSAWDLNFECQGRGFAGPVT